MKFFEKIFETLGVTLFLIIIWTFIGSFFLAASWNYVIPTIFNLPEINLLQAFCLILIVRIIFPTINVNKNKD